MSSSYATTKLLYPSTKRQKIRIVSSKAQPLHKPKRVRVRIASKIEEKSGNVIFTDTFTKVTSVTEKRTRVHLERNLIPDQGNHLKPSYYSGTTGSETKRRPSRTRGTAHDSAQKERLKLVAPHSRQRSSYTRQQPVFDRAAKPQPSRDRRSHHHSAKTDGEKPAGACSKLYAPNSQPTSCYKGQKLAFGSARRPQSSQYPSKRVVHPSTPHDSAKKERPVAAYNKPTASDSRQIRVPVARVPKQRSGIRMKETSDKKPGQRMVPVELISTTTQRKPVVLQDRKPGPVKIRNPNASPNNYVYTPQNNSSRKFSRIVSPASRCRPTQRVTTERHVACSANRPLNVTRPVFSKDLAALNASLLTFFKEKVSLPQKDTRRNSKAVNDLLKEILHLIRKQDETFGLRILNTGSYYEKLKVSRPIEFDVMLAFDAHRFTRFFSVEYSLRDPETMRFAKLVFKDYVADGKKVWGDFLTTDGKYLSPGKLSRRFYELVLEASAVVNKRKGKQTRVQPLKGPAVTLTIDGQIDLDLVLSVEIAEWPKPANGWGDFSSKGTWPNATQVEQIKKLNPKCYLVAKTCPTETKTRVDSRVFWRISFSEAEKSLLLPASPDKKCYRIVKAIFQAKEKNLRPLSSYDLKNAFLHYRCQHPQAKINDTNMAESVVKYFHSLICHLRKGSLPHFFISRVNLFAEFSKEVRESIAHKLECCLVNLEQNPGSFLRSLNP